MLRSLRNIKILFLTSTRTSSGIQTVPRVGEPFVGTLECILQSNLFICQHTTQQKLYYLLRIATSGPPEQLGCSVYSSIHDSIMPSKLKLTSRIAPDTNQVSTLKAACLNSAGPKLSDQIDKNVIISMYNVSCQKRGIKENVTTLKKGEPTTTPTTYPTISQLIRGCSMKPSPNHQYWVKDLTLDHVIIELLKSSKSFLADEDIVNLSEVNSLYQKMIGDIAEFKTLDFCALHEPRLGYAEQTEIQE